MSGITWLSSYPKSGNTWCRAFITAYLHGGNIPDLNRLVGAPISGARVFVDRWLNLNTREYDRPSQEALRPEAYRRLARACFRKNHSAMIKCHDAWKLTPLEEPLFPPAATHRIIYLVRDPRDVAVSFAHHLGRPPDEIAAQLGNPRFSLAVNGPSTKVQLMQQLGTWSQHVMSWIDYCPLHACLIRYEDLKKDPAREWTRMLEYLRIPVAPAVLEKSLQASSFQALKAREQFQGFKEASKEADAPFFRSGEAGLKGGELSAEARARIEVQHGPVMRRLGYL